MSVSSANRRILPRLYRALIRNCPAVKEFREKAKEAFLKSSYPELSKMAYLMSQIDIPNATFVDNEKPVFTLMHLAIFFSHSKLPIVTKDEEIRKKRVAGNHIFYEIVEEMKRDAKLPTVIQLPKRVHILEDHLNSSIVFGLPQEIKIERQKLMKQFDNARIINY